MKTNKLKILSGGQSGVDRAALDFALSSGIRCAGWCPAGRWAEDGLIHKKYPLKESNSEDPAERTRLNIDECDGTLIIYRMKMDEGTMYTLNYLKEKKKPAYIINERSAISPTEFEGWLKVNKIKKLNIAGPRESSNKGTYEFAMRVLQQILC